MKNIGSGAAFNIIIDFYDAISGDLVLQAGHSVDYLGKFSSEEQHIHIPREIWNSIKYTEREGELVAPFTIEIGSHDIFGKHHATSQDFVLDKKTGEITKVLGTFDFKKES